MPSRGEPKTAEEYECGTCGSAVPADANECPVCGERFEQSASSSATPEPCPSHLGKLPPMGPWKHPAGTEAGPSAKTESKTEPPSEGPRRRIKVVAVAVVVVLIGVGAWVLFPTVRPTPPGGSPTVVQGITVTSFPVDSTTHNVAMPATVTAGDLLIVLLANDGNPNVMTPGGWTFFFGWDSWGGATTKFSMYAKRADGTEGGTTVDFQTSMVEKAAAQVDRIAGWRDSGTIANDVEVNVTGSTDANPDPLSLDPTNWGVENTLWIAAYGAEGDNNATAYPTNYTGGTYTESDRSATSASLASAYRTAAVGAEDAAPFTISAPSFWIACTVGVRLAA